MNDREELARAGARAHAPARLGAHARRRDDRGSRSGSTATRASRSAPDTVIEPNVRLRGADARRRRLPASAQGAILTDAAVADGVDGEPVHRRARTSTIGARAIVGPFSRLRPGSEHRRGGPRRELRRDEEGAARQGREGEPPHLPRRRDDRRGRERRRGHHHLQLRRREEAPDRRSATGAFIGSDSILVAPIEIGAGAYVAAGSTVTESVPPGALALGRAQQVTKEGWVARRQAEKQNRGAAGVRAGATDGPGAAGRSSEASGTSRSPW